MNTKLRLLFKGLFYSLVFLLLLAVSAYVYLYKLPKGPELTAVKTLNSGRDSFVIHAFKDSKRKSIKVWTYKPKSWKDQDKILFVMHGAGRNADDYLDAWVNLAEENNLLVLAPAFENKFSKYITNDYQENNLFTYFGRQNPESEWASTVIENIFDHVKAVNDISNEEYDMFGHSAGGQFIHRMLLVNPDARVRTAIAANAGCYTLPDEEIAFPYGLRRLDIDKALNVQKSHEKKLVILLGEKDNNLSLGRADISEQAMKQGAHRLERGSYYFEANEQLSKKEDWTFNWKIDTVRNVAHDFRAMSEHAIKWINEREDLHTASLN